MTITPIQKSSWLELRLEGRLDAAWSDHFFDTVAAQIREGRHDIRIDALGLEYISSAGMRAMLRVHKELKTVNGSFAVVRASDFVIQTLSMSGFDSLLALDTPSEEIKAQAVEVNDDGASIWRHDGVAFERYELDADATMDVRSEGAWQPWQSIEADDCRKIALGRDTIALGTGAPGADYALVKDCLGDFAAAAGCVAWQPGNGADAPDYLVQEGRFVPEMLAANALRATGGFSQLLRFQPEEGHSANALSGLMDESMKRVKPTNSGASLSLSSLLDAVLSATNSTSAAFVALAEVEGLVGVSTARSPGLITPTDKPEQFPDIRDWLSFCGERLHAGSLAVIVGFIDASKSGRKLSTLPAYPSREGWRAHIHASVFPFRPLPNGKIYMSDNVHQLFTGAEPTALMHLVEDQRPALGLGESSFRRGACWCASAHFISEGK